MSVSRIASLPASPSAGPVQLHSHALSALRPVAHALVRGGVWGERRGVNRRTSVPGGHEQLRRAGNLRALELAAHVASGDYPTDMPFMDSDLYKWLEAVAWVMGDDELEPAEGRRLAALMDEWVSLLASAQEDDGYLNSYVQVVRPPDRFADLGWGHELYTAGHLIQAAIAHQRSVGRPDLSEIAQRMADCIERAVGDSPDRSHGVDGHPGLETALVELYRSTGERRYLDLARIMVERRGHGMLGSHRRFGGGYWQDEVPVREADDVTGHAVRQLYYLVGAVDVAMETNDEPLLTAVERLWERMVAAKTYLTGAIGAHHTDEAFGDPYELPSERAYGETCASIASVMLSWRLLLATGNARYADLLERTLYNGVLPAVALSGDRYLYVNPLQVRAGHQHAGGDADARRTSWFRCACCPPNVMRLLASLEHYVAAGSPQGFVLHQFIPGEYTVVADIGELVVRVETDYPRSGTVDVTILAGPAVPWTLTLRAPEWAPTVEISVDGVPIDAQRRQGWVDVSRPWQPGETLRLVIPMAIRLTRAHPRVDAVRGCVAIERGPLVYCIEQVDQDGDAAIDDVLLDPDGHMEEQYRPDMLGGVVCVVADGLMPSSADTSSWWPYREVQPVDANDQRPVRLTAIPYYAWGHRDPGPMRVWIPVSSLQL